MFACPHMQDSQRIMSVGAGHGSRSFAAPAHKLLPSWQILPGENSLSSTGRALCRQAHQLQNDAQQHASMVCMLPSVLICLAAARYPAGVPPQIDFPLLRAELPMLCASSCIAGAEADSQFIHEQFCLYSAEWRIRSFKTCAKDGNEYAEVGWRISKRLKLKSTLIFQTEQDWDDRSGVQSKSCCPCGKPRWKWESL